MSRGEGRSRDASGRAGRPLGDSLPRRLRTVASELRSGGLIVTTPADVGGTDPIHVRTLIQFDGDVVTSVLASKLDDRVLLDRHFAGVHALLTDLDRLRRQLLTVVVGAVLAVPSIASVGAFLASADRSWTTLAWALGLHGTSSAVIAVAIAVGRRWILARILGWGRPDLMAQVGDRSSSDDASRLF